MSPLLRRRLRKDTSNKINSLIGNHVDDVIEEQIVDSTLHKTTSQRRIPILPLITNNNITSTSTPFTTITTTTSNVHLHQNQLSLALNNRFNKQTQSPHNQLNNNPTTNDQEELNMTVLHRQQSSNKLQRHHYHNQQTTNMVSNN